MVAFAYALIIGNLMQAQLKKPDEALEAISQSKYFSPIDLAQGYIQVAIKPNAIPKTAFWV